MIELDRARTSSPLDPDTPSPHLLSHITRVAYSTGNTSHFLHISRLRQRTRKDDSGDQRSNRNFKPMNLPVSNSRARSNPPNHCDPRRDTSPISSVDIHWDRVQPTSSTLPTHYSFPRLIDTQLSLRIILSCFHRQRRYLWLPLPGSTARYRSKALKPSRLGSIQPLSRGISRLKLRTSSLKTGYSRRCWAGWNIV